MKAKHIRRAIKRRKKAYQHPAIKSQKRRQPRHSEK